jgi:hypothetical protein
MEKAVPGASLADHYDYLKNERSNRDGGNADHRETRLLHFHGFELYKHKIVRQTGVCNIYGSFLKNIRYGISINTIYRHMSQIQRGI